MKRPPKAQVEVTVDVVIFTIQEEKLKVLLIERINEPFKDQLSLPGGFVWEKEVSTGTAQRVLKDKTNIHDVYIEQLYTFDEPARDPRRQIITISYFALVSPEKIKLERNNIYKPQLFLANKLPKLAFDHERIIKYAVKRLRAKLEYTNVAYSLLSEKFSLTALQKTYEIILAEPQDKRNFRRKYLSLDLLEATSAMSTGKHRPAKLYRFKKHQPIELREKIF